MEDLSYFQEDYEFLVSEEVGHIDEGTGEYIIDSPAVWETRQRIKPKPETKSYTKVERVAKVHKGNRDDVVDRFIAMHLEGIQWNWLDEYLEWEEDSNAIIAWNIEFEGTVSHTQTNRVVTGEGEDAVVTYEEVEVLFEAKEVPEEPERPPELTVANWRNRNAEMLQLAALPGIDAIGVKILQVEDDIRDLRVAFEARIDALEAAIFGG